jgi:hypothetical protein
MNTEMNPDWMRGSLHTAGCAVRMPKFFSKNDLPL